MARLFMTRLYDRAMLGSHQQRLYGGSDYFNYGYWRPEEKSQRQACDALLDELVALIPNCEGSILDVACGLGATTRRLMEHYAPEHIVGINVSDVQLARARQSAPGCRFVNMDATNLSFPDGSFQAVLCVEAAFHFDTREQFLNEAWRVLAPGGWLVLSDILFPRFMRPVARLAHVAPANYVRDPASYGALMRRTGFEEVTVKDATAECWHGFRDHLRRWPAEESAVRGYPPLKALGFKAGFFVARSYLGLSTRTYVLAAGQKPV